MATSRSQVFKVVVDSSTKVQLVAGEVTSGRPTVFGVCDAKEIINLRVQHPLCDSLNIFIIIIVYTDDGRWRPGCCCCLAWSSINWPHTTQTQWRQWRSQKCELEGGGIISLPLPSFFFFSLSYPPFPSFFLLPSLESKTRKLQLRVKGSAASFPSTVWKLEQSLCRNQIWRIIGLKCEICWQQFYNFPESLIILTKDEIGRPASPGHRLSTPCCPSKFWAVRNISEKSSFRKIFVQMQHFWLKSPFLGNSGATMEFWAPTISSVGNSQLSVENLYCLMENFILLLHLLF